MNGAGGGGGEEITVNVKFGGRTIPVTLSTDCRIKELKAMLQPLTNVLVRGQKLISKGKILTDDASLRDSDVKDGTKMMLMASQGLHQGDGPILKNAATKPISRSAVNAKAVELSVGKSRVDHWKRMRVISLSSSNLKAIPEEVWACGSSIRLLDASNNTIRGVPSQIANLTSLDRLDLSKNDIVDDSLSWEGVMQLKLSSLFLSQNHLTTLPPALGTMTSLVHLVVADNKLTSLPAEIGLMTELKTLNARNNRITSIDPSIGNCKYLLELDLSSNLLSEIPQTVGNLQNLKELYLSNNGLKAVPSSLFKNCTSLRKLDLHRTEITMNMLREMEGWNEFDERRRAKTQNLLDYRSLHSTDFDEGADIC
uniref:Ubiquitin-like domain-containing protein n=1 Tax=Kalanchoe fedtschenkoi TaxID=63787 RepID=A0A7N1A9F5_KALFE